MPYIGPDLTKVYVQQVASDWDATIMTAIAGAESGWNPDARSPTDDWGLFQINRYWHRDLFDRFQWNNPYQNTQMAHIVWSSQHYSGWSTYNNGAYLKYLGQSGGGGGIPQGVGSGAMWDQPGSPPPGPGGMDYSDKVRHSGARGQQAFVTTRQLGLWLWGLK